MPRSNVPKLDLEERTSDEPNMVPYKDTWLEAKVESIDKDGLNAILSFDGVDIVMRVRTLDGSVDGIDLGEAKVKPLSWGRKTSLVAEVVQDKIDSDTATSHKSSTSDSTNDDPIFSRK